MDAVIPVDSSEPSLNSDSSDRSKLEALERELSAIHGLLREQNVNQRRVGSHLRVILAQRLFEAKYKSARKLFRSEFPDIPERTLYRRAKIAEKFTEEAVERLGTTKLDLCLTHLEQNPGAVLPEDPLEYELQIPGRDGSSVVKKLRNCSASDIRRSLPRKNKRPSTKQTNQSNEIEPDKSAEAEEISKRTIVWEFLRAGLGMTMFLYGILAPSSMLTGFLIPVGSLLVFKAAQPFIRLGRSWFHAATAGENLLEVAVNLRKKGISFARRAASGVGSALSRPRLSELGKKTVRLPGRIV